MAEIEIDPDAGFCFGVDKVIRTAEAFLRKGEEVIGLGDMVHNSAEMERLHSLGMRTITHDELKQLKPERVLLRAHGEPPSTYRWAEENHVELMDGTCPIVIRLQKKIREAYGRMDHSKEQLVIFGKRDHPETIGLLGQVNGDAEVVTIPEDVEQIPAGKTVVLFSQTTMDPDQFREVEERLRNRLKKIQSGDPDTGLRSECTICGQMKRRKPGLTQFVKRHAMILFVSGKHSSNGKMLFEYSRSLNANAHWISHPDEIDPAWLKDAASIGITGATSTSMEQLESVRSRVKKFTSA